MTHESIPNIDGELTEWESFLVEHPWGQYQQSAMWGQYKKQDGWTPRIRIIHRKNRITGGFMLLIKKTGLGPVGYIPKGPLSAPGLVPEWEHEFARAILELGLTALIIQPPDNDTETCSRLVSAGYREASRLGIIDSTLLVPLADFREKSFGNIQRTRKQTILRSMKSGLVIREGKKEDLPYFFDLLKITCRRQKVTRINPGNLNNLDRLWDLFSENQNIRLTLAVHHNEILAALLCIVFGNRLTLWKKGWTGSGSDYHPNDLLYYEAFTWAWSRNLQVCDFAGIDPDIAERLLNGKEWIVVHSKSRDIYNLSFGGSPILLPKAMIKFNSRIKGIAFDLYDAIAPEKHQILSH